MHDVNIVIVNYEMEEQIGKCLASLFKDLQNSDLDIHISIIDNSPKNNVCKLLAGTDNCKMKCVLNKKNLGFAKAQNRGLKEAEAKYHFVLNPDTVFFENHSTIDRLYQFMEENKKVGIVGPKITYPDGALQHSCYRFPKFLQPIYSRTKLGKIGKGKRTADYFFMKDFEHNETIPVDWIMGAAMFVRGQAIDEIGLFDERFWMYAEDSDWCRRMWEKEWHVYYTHDIQIQHVHGRGSAKVQGVVKALLKNKLARTHLMSWLKYMWKWRKTGRYYT